MPVVELPIQPGIIKDNSPLLSEGRWVDADKVRFRNVGGKTHPEVIGGWEDLITQTFEGKCRRLHAWENLSDEKLLAVGTSSHVYVVGQGFLWDVTPFQDTGTLTDALAVASGDETVTVEHASHGLLDDAVVYLRNATTVGGIDLGVSGSIDTFTATEGSKTLLVTATAHGLSTHDRITIAGATDTGGIPAAEINTTHTVNVVSDDSLFVAVNTAATADEVNGGAPTYTGLRAYTATVVDANTYTVEADNAATSTISGGGTLTYEYAINPGRENTTAQAGYSTGTYSSGRYSLPSGESDLRARVWVMSNFGEVLIANYRNSMLYQWDNVLSQRMTAIAATDAPQQNLSHMVTPEKFLIALGTEDATTSTFDAMQIAWAVIEGGLTTSDWTPTDTNSAGDIRIAEGSRIIAGASMPYVSLVWTDTALYQLQYIPDVATVWRPDLLGTGCGLIGPNAYSRAGDSGQVFWLASTREFMVWQGGSPITIQCPVRDFFFDNLASRQEDLIYCGTNDKFNEVWWFYPDSTNENARYVAFNYSELHWTVGTFPITAWVSSGVGTNPVGAWSDGTLKIQEKGNSANGSGFDAYVEAGYMDVQEGGTLMFARRYIPDFQGLEGGVRFTLGHKLWPQGSETKQVIGTVDAETEKLDFRTTARQIAPRFDWVSSPTAGRLGRIQMDVQAVGSRR